VPTRYDLKAGNTVTLSLIKTKNLICLVLLFFLAKVFVSAEKEISKLPRFEIISVFKRRRFNPKEKQ
jgi:hypothetical protein